MSKANFLQSEHEVQAEQIRGHFQRKTCNKIQTTNHKLQKSFNLQRRKHFVPRIHHGFKKVSNSQRDKNLGGEIFSTHEGSTKPQRSEL
jgi:hypothetical protein